MDGTRFQPNYPHRRHLHHHDRGQYRHHHHHFFFSRRFLRASHVISILIIDGTISYSLFEFHDILNAFLLAILCSHTPTTEIQRRLAEKYKQHITPQHRQCARRGNFWTTKRRARLYEQLTFYSPRHKLCKCILLRGWNAQEGHATDFYLQTNFPSLRFFPFSGFL